MGLGELFNNSTDFTYDYLKKVISDDQITFNYSYFTSHELTQGTQARKIAIYKALHPDFMLREYAHRDSNQLNNRFYTELLHILGLSEVKEEGKVLIKPSANKQGLINETIEQLATDKGLYDEHQAFEAAFDLVINWLNRVLFIKLFESQLVSFNNNKDQYRFLSSSKVKNYDDLNNLFFKVLGKPTADRIGDKLDHIPYLNSSLFEVSPSEIKYLTIASLDNSATTELFKTSNLKNWSEYKSVTKVSTLKYLLDFLESYDFSSVDDGDLLTQSTSEIINPAVLGLIFEKLNGYKEGSFFTPGYITEFMSELSVQKAIVAKFNEALGIDAKSINEVCNFIGTVYKTEDLKRYNDIVNSLRIVDPAVGSGHFLVSVLNYIIYAKSQLGILWDGQRRITEEVEIVDDTLCLYCGDQLFAYKRNLPETLRLQKAIFKEKQNIIENCLFGVDINEKSVTICQLRLWIELLKNAYYLDKDANEMELLPNIDINIKANNSLISKYKPAQGKSITKTGETKKVRELITSYKESVRLYKHSGDKRQKQKTKNQILQIKDSIYSWVQQDLFQDVTKTDHNFIYKNAMEWLIEFPELLDESGKFQGFDLVIGNPPYIKEPGNKAIFEPLKFDPLYQGKMDIWYFFMGRGLDLLKQNGALCFIAPNNWITSAGASKIRNDVLERAKLLKIVDFSNYMVFDSASIQTMVFMLEKHQTEEQRFSYSIVNDSKKIKKDDVVLFLSSGQHDYFDSYTVRFDRDERVNKIFSMASEDSKMILDKMRAQAIYLFPSELSQGIVPNPDVVNSRNIKKIPEEELGNIKVGDGVFIVDRGKFDHLDSTERKYIKPLLDPVDVRPYYCQLENHRKELLYITRQNYLNDAPSLEAHLNRFRWIMQERRENLDGRRTIYELHWPREDRFFNGSRVLSVRKCARPTFCYTEDDFCVPMAFNIIKSDRFNMRFLTGLLNSTLLQFWFFSMGKKQGDAYQIDTQPLLEVPLRSQPEAEKQIEALVELIESNPSENIQGYLESIDDIVFNLYGLTEEEINYVKKVVQKDL